jgi:hypothetical protein
VLARVREEMRRDLMAVTSRSDAAPAPAVTQVASRDAVVTALTRRLGELERWRLDQEEFVRQQALVNYGFENRLGRVSTRTTALDNEMVRNMLRVSATGGEFTR